LTKRAKSTACNDRIQTLHCDQLSREEQLAASEEKTKRELLKQLDYVKTCRKHAEHDFLNESLASEATMDVMGQVWKEFLG
jgi:hypothetical protein